MESSEILSETTIPSECLGLGMLEQAQLNIEEKIPEQVPLCQTRLRQQSEPMFDVTFPKLSNSSSCISRENDLALNLSRQSHSSSTTMKTSPHERNLSLLNSISQRSMQSRPMNRVKESEREDLSLEAPINCHISSQLINEDAVMEDLVLDTPHPRQLRAQMTRETESVGNFDNWTCPGMDDMELKECSEP